MAHVGGKTNDRLKAQIYREFRTRSIWYWDRWENKPKPACNWNFASVKELRETLHVLRAQRDLQRAKEEQR